ncbi:MarR family transcriptional regulator [Streptomonospora sp. PA3]|uniref:MarR family winged helix-turn-helix transcriptional regulator n=1 Tax=Streptomonospora sp. PA3 TaxID=2607326 RepID=UPI0012DE91E3|nr:MarR family transcriptional regulator [Streptomonospora sp. PA3]MUL44055.1 MarR family transcriptional regulator [Streptomonospora sp. PA3]
MASGSAYPPSLLNRFSFLLGKLYFRALDAEADELSSLHVSVKQQAALTVLADEGPMTQHELGRRLGIDRTTVVGVVDGLDGDGLVERRRSPTDRRAYLLTLTPAGRDTQEQGRQRVAEAEHRFLGALGESDRARLRELLARALGDG